MKDNIKGFPGYFISREGFLYSRYKSGGTLTEHYKKMKLYTRSNGYQQAVLKIRSKGKIRRAYIHRLVAEVYIPNPDNKPCVCHRDSIRSHNSVENLYWGTNEENTKQAKDEGHLGCDSKLRALIFSDLHLNDYTKYSSREDTALIIWHELAKRCSSLNIPLIHCGDILHKPENISLELATKLVDFLGSINKLPDFKMYIISGNHTIKETSKIDILPMSWDSLLSKLSPNIQCIDYKRVHFKNLYFYGIPYVDHNLGLSSYLKNLKLVNSERNKHILLLHTDYPGAKDTDGRVIDSAENINLNMLNRFDLVLCGHIHKPQRLSKKVYMLGAPYQQRRTDKNCKMGYWELYSDLSMKFVELKGFPKFIDVESEDEVKEDGNYYTVIPKKSSSEKIKADHKITKQLSKKRLAKRYMKQKGINDKKKEDLLINVLKESEV